jgi:hypothetical protein
MRACKSHIPKQLITSLICVFLISLKSTATAESLESYKELVEVATTELKDKMEGIDAKLADLLEQSAAKSEAASAEQQLIKQEQLSTERCLQICDQLSKHIDQIQIELKNTGLGSETTDADVPSEAIIDVGLQECKEGLILTTAKLEKHMQDLMNLLINKAKTAMDADDAADLLRVRDEWEITRRGVQMCSQAEQYIRQNVSDIENYGTGDALQFMVSTEGKTLRGRNRGLGWRTRQVGGYTNDESLQQLSRDLTSPGLKLTDLSNDLAEGNLPPATSKISYGQRQSEFQRAWLRTQIQFRAKQERSSQQTSGEEMS